MNSTFRSGRDDPGGIGDLAAVEPGQADVGDQQVDPLRRLQDAQAGRPVAGFQGLVTQLIEHIDDEQPHQRLVLDHKNRLAASRQMCLRGLLRGDLHFLLRMAPRQVQADRRPHAGLGWRS